MNYIPIFKYKERIDIKAYTLVNMNEKEEYVPLVELFLEEKIEMKQIDSKKKFYLSMLIEKNMQFHNAVDYFIDIASAHENIIPVINSDYNYDNKKLSFKYAKKLFKKFEKVAIKINGIKDIFIRENFENILLSVIDDYENLDVFLDIDFAYNYTREQMIEYFGNAINYFLDEIDDEIRTFIISGSIVKVSSIGLDDFHAEDRCNTIKNNMLLAYYELKKIFPELNIKYSDYTIDEKYMFIDDIGGGNFYPAVKYTKNNGDICIYKSPNITEFKDYIKIAKMIESETFFSKSHCCGCEYISDIANSRTDGKGTGNPSTWKTRMMCHHVETMYKLLA